MILPLVFGLWVFYAILSGIRDAYAFSQRVSYENKILGLDIHKYIAGMRLVIAILVHTLLDVYYPISQSLMLTIGLFFVHPLFHNGAYFETRKKESKGQTYPDGFFTTKKKDDSSAIIDFNSASIRILLFVFGILLWSIVIRTN